MSPSSSSSSSFNRWPPHQERRRLRDRTPTSSLAPTSASASASASAVAPASTSSELPREEKIRGLGSAFGSGSGFSRDSRRNANMNTTTSSEASSDPVVDMVSGSVSIPTLSSTSTPGSASNSQSQPESTLGFARALGYENGYGFDSRNGQAPPYPYPHLQARTAELTASPFPLTPLPLELVLPPLGNENAGRGDGGMPGSGAGTGIGIGSGSSSSIRSMHEGNIDINSNTSAGESMELHGRSQAQEPEDNNDDDPMRGEGGDKQAETGGKETEIQVRRTNMTNSNQNRDQNRKRRRNEVDDGHDLPTSGLASFSSSSQRGEGLLDSSAASDNFDEGINTTRNGDGPEWTEWEDGILQSFLANPIRTLMNPFPPGTLPESNTIDELTNQVFHFLSYSRSRKGSQSQSQSRSQDSVSLILDNDSETVSISSPTKKTFSTQAEGKEWPHTWRQTRDRLFEIARLESKGLEIRPLMVPNAASSGENGERGKGGDLFNKKVGVGAITRLARPGIKRVSSMDFLDEVDMHDHGDGAREQNSMIDEDEDEQTQGDGRGDTRAIGKEEGLGRVLRLSTSLQNSSKQAHTPPSLCPSGPEPLVPSSTVTAPGPPISVTPSSLLPRRTTPMKRTPSVRSLGSASRPASLLQRGKSFTAKDLEDRRSSRSLTISSDIDNSVPQVVPVQGNSGMLLPMVTPDRPSHYNAFLNARSAEKGDFDSSPTDIGADGCNFSSPASILESSPVEEDLDGVRPDHPASPSPTVGKSTALDASLQRPLAFPIRSNLTPRLNRSMSSMTAGEAEAIPYAKQQMFLGSASTSNNEKIEDGGHGPESRPLALGSPLSMKLPFIASAVKKIKGQPPERKRLKKKSPEPERARLASPFDL